MPSATVSMAFEPNMRALRAIALHQVEAGLNAVLVVAVIGSPGTQVLRVDVGADIVDIRGRERTVIGNAGCADGVDDQGVHAVGGLGARRNLAPGKIVVEARIARNHRNEGIEFPCLWFR